MRDKTLHAAALVAAGLSALGSAAHAGPPFRTDDPEPVEFHHWEFYTFSSGTHVAGDTAGLGPAIEINYGAAPNLQLHVIAPIAFDQPQGSGTKFGYGDTELGMKYRFVQEDENGWRPMVGMFPLVEVPTGNASRGLGAGHAQEYIPIWLQKSFGPWLTYGGGGYWFNPGIGSKNYWFAGWLLQRQVTDQLALGGEVFHQTASVPGGPDQTGFDLGGVFDINEHNHILFSAGTGIQHASATNAFSYYAGYQLTF